MGKEKTIEVLNSLITINNDRIEGYDRALKETEDFGLKTLFEQFISNSEKCKQELISEVNLLGGKATEGTMTSLKFFRAWMHIKAALTGNDRKAILNSCWNRENKAMDTYNIVLENNSEHLSPEQYTMIYSQILLLKDDYDHVKTMRDMLIDNPIATQTKSVVLKP